MNPDGEATLDSPPNVTGRYEGVWRQRRPDETWDVVDGYVELVAQKGERVKGEVALTLEEYRTLVKVSGTVESGGAIDLRMEAMLEDNTTELPDGAPAPAVIESVLRGQVEGDRIRLGMPSLMEQSDGRGQRFTALRFQGERLATTDDPSAA